MKKILIAVLVVVIAAFAAPVFAATNPFMDVPASHWAYDAVSQLAARGIISGYPDGSLKGGQPGTRYEIASLIARSLARVDLEKASKQDVELLKKLIVEFKDELDALGVRVDRLDERVAVLESEIGGWHIWGDLDFRAKFTGHNEADASRNDSGLYNRTGKNDFYLDHYRVYLSKRIDENTSFTTRLGATGGSKGGDDDAAVVWQRYYVTTKLPYDVTFIVGRQPIDYEADLDLYIDDDALVGDYNRTGFTFIKNWGIADLSLSFIRQGDNGWLDKSVFLGAGGAAALADLDDLPQEYTEITAKLNFNFNERVYAGLLGYYDIPDEEYWLPTAPLSETDTDLSTFGIYAGFKFTPSIELKGIYYFQNQGDTIGQIIGQTATGYDDSANAWKIILDVDQEALKFTSLWLEYSQIDNNFLYTQDPYAFDNVGILNNKPWEGDSSTSVLFVSARQQWNEKWGTFERYVNADYDNRNIHDATDWTFGVDYQLNPAVLLELAYDSLDFGDDQDDHLIRFRTFVTF
ncbi:MAG: S-layer homology domain-containing protein [Synergistaceae bacterium]|jgi:hypothetical protein|nr:S-layer homology domain-containing protein [Synergistaceae bacterium]